MGVEEGGRGWRWGVNTAFEGIRGRVRIEGSRNDGVPDHN